MEESRLDGILTCEWREEDGDKPEEDITTRHDANELV